MALAASAVSWFTFMIAPNWLSPDLQSILFVAWALPVTAWMGHAVFARSDLAPAQPRRAPAPSRPGLAA
jgi:hypothetical protein